MFSGFTRFADGTVTRISTVDELETAWADGESLIWLDYLEPTEDELRALRAVIPLDGTSIEDCLYGAQRPRIDEFDEYIFLVLYGLVGLSDTDEFEPKKLAIFCGRRFLITVHEQALRTIHSIAERCARNTKTVLSKGIDFLLYAIIDGMVDKYVFAAEEYEKRLEDLEEASLGPAVGEALLVDSAGLRKDILRLRNLAVSQRELLTPLADGQYDHVADTLEQRFNHVRDHLTQVIELVDRLREQLHSVRDNYHTALADRANEIVKTLTIFATILLPLTFIAGVYGMNLPLWPPPEHPLSFWGVLGAMVVIGTVLLAYFRRKTWL